MTRLLPAALLAATALLVAGTADGARRPAAPELFPTPQSVEVSSGTVPVPELVRVVTTPQSDAGAIATVRASLADAGLSTTRDPSAELSIFVGRDASAERSLGVQTAAALPPSGYVLAVGHGRDGRARIVLDGRDRDGQFYAAQTLRQLLDHRRSLPVVTVRDWPSLRWRGIVEGFYGRPWPQAERLGMLDFMAAHKLNFFMYGPKADAYLRASWRTPFPPSYLARLHALVERAAADHVTFDLVVSPGLSACYTSPQDQATLLAKLESAYAAGVRSFTIALDDIDPAPRCPDDLRYGNDDLASAVVQAALVNTVEDRFVRTHRGVLPLILVPTQYSGVGATPYTDTLANHLDPRVVVQWTGHYGVSVVLTQEDVHAATFIYRHPLMVWDNYFVTDYAPQYLALGALDRHDASLAAAVRGLVADPMVQPEASRIGLFTVADYDWNTGAYVPLRSWNASLREFAGDDPSAVAALRAFADANWGTMLNPVQAPTLTALIQAFWTAWARGDTSVAPKLDAWLATLADAPDTLAGTLANTEFLNETSPWLSATSYWAAAARAALEELLAAHAGDAKTAAAKAASIPGLIANARRFTVGITFAAVAGGALERFVADAQSAATAP